MHGNSDDLHGESEEIIMKKVVRILKMGEQDEQRQIDLAHLSPKERTDALLSLQSQYLRWDLNPKIQRVATIKRFNFQDVH